jgi:hypothetical protein
MSINSSETNPVINTPSDSNPQVPVSAEPVVGSVQLEPKRLARSLKRFLPELEAQQPEQLVGISIDVAAPSMLILKRWPSWQPLLARIHTLPEVDAEGISNLEGYAEATLQANAEYLTSVAAPSELVEKLAEAERLRTILWADCDVLVKREVLPPGSLNELTGLPGYRNVAVDLSALVSMLDRNEPLIQGKTAATRAELDRANLLVQYIFRNSVERETKQPHVLAAGRLRQQAFSRMSRAYDELRRCVAFFYPDPEEAERIAPSFYRGRGGRPPETAVAAPRVEPSTATHTSAPVNEHAHPAEPTTGSASTNPNALPSRSPFSS